jgi:hypothetical protein
MSRGGGSAFEGGADWNTLDECGIFEYLIGVSDELELLDDFER